MSKHYTLKIYIHCDNFNRNKTLIKTYPAQEEKGINNRSHIQGNTQEMKLFFVIIFSMNYAYPEIPNHIAQKEDSKTYTYIMYIKVVLCSNHNPWHYKIGIAHDKFIGSNGWDLIRLRRCNRGFIALCLVTNS